MKIMVVEPPLLPIKTEAPRLATPSFRVKDIPSPTLEKLKDEVRMVGVDKSIGRVQENLNDILILANRRLQQMTTESNLRYIQDAESGITMVKLIDTKTGKVVKEYPPEWAVENAAILMEAGRVKSIIG